MFWSPKTEEDIENAILTDTLVEGQHLEVKSEARNESIAKAICAMSIDGGVFILGVGEREVAVPSTKNKINEHFLDPKPLNGLGERVQNIARGIDPPVAIRTTPIKSHSNHHEGYLVVEVPASQNAPHMVESRYYKRCGPTSAPMSNSEVRLHITSQQQAFGMGLKILDEFELEDIIDKSLRKFGHVYLIAQPAVSIDSPGLRNLIASEGSLRSLMKEANAKCLPNISESYPPLYRASNVKQVREGVRLSSSSVVDPLAEDFYEPGLLQVTILKTGGIRILIGRGTGNSSTGPIIMDSMILAYVQRIIYLALRLSEVSGYASNWSFGVKATGIKNAIPVSDMDHTFHSDYSSTFDEDSYSSTALEPVFRLENAPHAVAKELVGDMFRVLNVTNHYESLDSEEIALIEDSGLG